MSDKRRFVRHPTSVPLEIWQKTDESVRNYETLQDIGLAWQETDESARNYEVLRDIGLGGLSFSSNVAWEIDIIVCIQIPMIEMTFQMSGRIVWCKPHSDYFDVGVEFMVKKEDSEKKDLIVDKICQISYFDPKTMNFISRLFGIPITDFKCFTRKLSMPQFWNS